MADGQKFSPLTAAIACLPEHIANAIRSTIGLQGGACNEIRLTLGGHAYITINGRNVLTSVICTEEDLLETVRVLSGNSLYTHSDTIREGFIFTDSGLRVGVCGRAVVHDNKIGLVRNITSVSIRIPGRYVGAADTLYPYILGKNGLQGMLIWSPPGVGKTTALRELAYLLSCAEPPYRTALIDTRYELSQGICGGLLDVFSGYPRAIGMEIAIRTMSPEIVICDEIAGDEDAAAVFKCASSGVAVVASAHAGSVHELMRRHDLRPIIESGIFPTLAGLYRSGTGVEVVCTKPEGELSRC